MKHRNRHTRALVVFGIGILGVLYFTRLGHLPPRWEEPRRCIVALEMLYNDNYVVPTVLGEIYGKKPPLQNWLLMVLAGFNPDRVGVFLLRWLSALATWVVAVLLIGLAPRETGRWRWLPGAMFLTTGIMIQYGRSGEIDPLFVMWTTSALTFFEWGRRRHNRWLQWIPSQLAVAAGVLTKGLAPLFFYPPVLLFLALQARKNPVARWRDHALPFTLGALGALTLVGAWLVPYALRGTLGDLGSTGSSEFLDRTIVGHSWGAIASHVAIYPLEVIGNLLPWSLTPLALAWRRPRTAVKELWTRCAYFRLLILAIACVVAFWWLMPGAKGRYVMPAYPLAVAAIARVFDRLRQGSGDTTSATYDRRAATVIVGLGLVGLTYAVVFVVHVEGRHVARDQAQVETARALAQRVRQDAGKNAARPLAVYCSSDLPLSWCFEVMKDLRQPLARPPARQAGYLFTPTHASPPDAKLLEQRAGMAAWRVASPPPERAFVDKETRNPDPR